MIVVTTTFSLLRHVSSSTRKSAVEQAESDSSVDVNEHDQSQQTTFCVADTDTRASVEPQEEEKGVEHQDEEEGEPEEDWNTGLKRLMLNARLSSKVNGFNSTKTVRGLLGLVVGFGSAMTGTSGPVLLLPLLILLKWPILPSLRWIMCNIQVLRSF